jgi:signal transduction histidine kinase
MDLTRILDWFAGYPKHYHTLFHCMDHDVLWVSITVVLDLAVAGGYLLIAKHWWINQRQLHNHPARLALGRMRNIFLFCGLCGYVFIPIKMFWPAWRLYDMFLVVLVWFTWRYAWGARDLKVMFSELSRSGELEAELEVSREESRRKSFFLNAVSHDLRSPLNAMSLSADVASMCVEAGDKKAALEAMDRLRLSARETAELLSGFMELGKLDWMSDRNAPILLDVGEQVRAAIREFEPLAERKGLYLRMKTPIGAPVSARSDRAKLSRILSNLINNAIKYTQRGGVELEVERLGALAAIHVTDTGVGIAPGDHLRIFDEFYQVNNDARDSAKGFGLGLAIARRLA